MPKRSNTTKSPNASLALTNFLLGVSTLLTLQFVYHICWMAQEYALVNVESSPKTYSAVIVVILAAYVWMKGGKSYQRYVIVALLTAIIVGYIVWLLGETGVGQYLQGANGFWA